MINQLTRSAILARIRRAEKDVARITDLLEDRRWESGSVWLTLSETTWLASALTHLRVARETLENVDKEG
jgi:hypothetical protein